MDKKAELYYMLYSLHKNKRHWTLQTRFDASSHELHRPLPEGKYKKVRHLVKDELCGKIMK